MEGKISAKDVKDFKRNSEHKLVENETSPYVIRVYREFVFL